jgi:hypothetical protein
MAYAEQIQVIGSVSAGQSPQYLPAVPTENTDQFEGLSQIEIMGQILLELRILNQQINELPRLLVNGLAPQDTPESYRADPTFNNLKGT